MLWICCACTAAYAVDAPRCPQCGAAEHVEQGSAEHEVWLAERVKPRRRASLEGASR